MGIQERKQREKETQQRVRRKQILDAAKRVFHTRGFSSATVEDIAKATGLLKGSLYCYFESKEDIFAQIIREPVEECLRRITEIRDSDLKWDEKINNALKMHLNVWHAYYGAVFTALCEFYIDVNSGVGEYIVDLFEQYKVIILDIIHQGIDSGEVSNELDPVIMFYSLLGMCSWMYKWYLPGGRLPVETIADQFAKIFIDGVKTRPLLTKSASRTQQAASTISA